MALILDGQAIAAKVKDELQQKIVELGAKNMTPGLAVVLVGDDPASALYVRNKTKACKKVGITTFDYSLPTDTTDEQLRSLIIQLNVDPRVHGILVQLPLPKHLNAQKLLQRIDPAKDVDGLHPYNLGLLLSTGEPFFKPCTPLGIMHLLSEAQTKFIGSHAVIVGRSNLVGKPMAHLLLAQHCTVTMCHSRTRDLASIVSSADIVVAAVGQPELIKGAWIKPGATVIDVGTNRVGEKWCGDVEFEAAAARAAVITPVPKGVGPMTIAMLLVNTYESARRMVK